MFVPLGDSAWVQEAMHVPARSFRDHNTQGRQLPEGVLRRVHRANSYEGDCTAPGVQAEAPPGAKEAKVSRATQCFVFSWIVSGPWDDANALLERVSETFLAAFGDHSNMSGSGLHPRAMHRRRGWLPSGSCNAIQIAFERAHGVSDNTMTSAFAELTALVATAPSVALVEARIFRATRSMSDMLVHARN